jgi:hypothetical protein
MGADLAARALQRVRGAHSRGGVAVCEVPGERRGELGEALRELADEAAMQILTSGGVADALDLCNEIAIE